MARAKQFEERLNLTLPKGTKDRATAVLITGEDRMTMAREAFMREIKRRERKLKEGER